MHVYDALRVAIVLSIILLVSAWNWETHEAFVDSLYYTTSTEKPLNLLLLKEGAVAPDKVFKDFVRHSYPASLQEARAWITKAQAAYTADNLDEASYAFGVASHYLSDSFAAPHTVSGEKYNDHSKYESHSSQHYEFVNCTPATIAPEQYDTILSSADNHGQEEWEQWMATKDPTLPQHTVAQTMEFLYPVFMYTFDARCNTLQPAEKIHMFYNPLQLTAILLTCIAIIFVAISLGKELAKKSSELIK